MIKEFLLLSVIYTISIIYNNNIKPMIIYYLKLDYYENLIISLLILIQIQQKGGNDIYFNKYLKYKNKYLKLKINKKLN